MYDELVKKLRELSHEFYLNDNNKYAEEKLKEAADAIERLQGKHFMMKKTAEWLAEKVPHWIPVSERFPEAGERILCYCRANIYEVMKMRTDGDWVYDTNHIYMRGFVTHWMPLPEPPKEAQDG